MNRISKLLGFAGLIALFALAGKFSAYAEDMPVYSVNVGMSGNGDSIGTVSESYPVCFATDKYDEYYTQTSSYAIDTSATTYSRPFDKWKAGEPVTVHAVINAKDGYRFSKDGTVVNVIGTNVALESKSISTKRIRVTLKYWPSMVLPCINAGSARYDENDEDRLIWDPVIVNGGNWKYYQVRVMSDDAGSKSVANKSVSTNHVDLSDMITGGSYTISIRTVGGTASKERYTRNSDWVTLFDDAQSAKAGGSGTFSGTGDTMVYLDASGKTIPGWVSVNGCWYYFDPENSNRAVVDKFKKIDGEWYYFGSNGVMKTGFVESDGHKYYMHTVSDGKLGKMETGWVATGSSGPYYFFNDGSIASLPLGALFTNGVTPDGYTVDETGKRIQ